MDLHEQGASSRTFVIAAIVCVLLQAGLAPQISIAGGRVNFMIILVCLRVFSGDPTRAVVCGFCSGLFYDLSAAVPVGVMSLLLTVGSFALVHSAAGQTGGSPSARGITVGLRTCHQRGLQHHLAVYGSGDELCGGCFWTRPAVFDPDGSGCHSVFAVRCRAAVRLRILRTRWSSGGHALQAQDPQTQIGEAHRCLPR